MSERELYGWVIEYGGDRDRHVAFFWAARHDRAHVEIQAARLRGVIVELFRKDPS